MDELKLKLSSNFMRGIVTKIISKAIYKKYGYKVDIQLNDIVIRNEEGKVHLHADLDAEVKGEEFVHIVKSIGLD